MKSSFPEKAFMRIAVSDDKEAFKELFFDFYPALCVFAGRYIASAETCEDIVQDTFLYIWKTVSELRLYLHSRIY